MTTFWVLRGEPDCEEHGFVPSKEKRPLWAALLFIIQESVFLS
jgi:hypothetical protein